MALVGAGDRVADAEQLIPRHSLNATDAVVLRTALDWRTILRAVGDDLVLVSADRRLLRTAKAEGLVTFDPESDDSALLDSPTTPDRGGDESAPAAPWA